MDEHQQQDFNWYSPESEGLTELRRSADSYKALALAGVLTSAFGLSILDYVPSFGSWADIADRYKVEGVINDYTVFSMVVLLFGVSLGSYYFGKQEEKKARVRSALEQKLFEDEQNKL